MREEEAVLVDLRIEEVEQLLGRDHVVREGTGGFGLIVIQIPLPPPLMDLLHYQRDVGLFPDTVRLPPVVEDVDIRAILAVEVGKFTDPLRKGDCSVFLLEGDSLRTRYREYRPSRCRMGSSSTRRIGSDLSILGLPSLQCSEEKSLPRRRRHSSKGNDRLEY